MSQTILLGMRRGVARKPRRDDGVHGQAPGFFEVQAPPGQGAADEVEALPLDERHRDEIRLDAAPLQLLGQPAHVPLRAALREGRLHGENEDSGGSVQ